MPIITLNSTLRPGLLVSLKTSLQGNVKYNKAVLEAEHITADGSERAKWETVRTVTDPSEHEAGRKAQSDARAAIVRVCIPTAFGLMCPEANKDDLTRAVEEAHRIADDFNVGAQLSRISLYLITGRVAPDDVEAVKAINNEVRELITRMESGVANMDVKVIREAANEATRLGAMLSPEAAGRVRVAIDAARSTARRIVKAGEEAAQEIDRATIRRLEEMRASFLDLDGETTEVAAQPEQGRAIDLTPAEPVSVPRPKMRSIEL